jgi:nicotinic acid mononucleotide adenylyltransferase
MEIITPPPRAAATAPLLLLPGSYNPPTSAHLALAHASLQATPQASLGLVLGTTIINKERTERATLLDRVLLLDQIARRTGQMGVFLTNQGLYVEQAQAARAAFPGASEIAFVVGYDKIEQIFDPRYYQDRDAALKELFALASFLVAPRATHAAADVAALLRQPDNQQFQQRVQVLPFPGDYRDIASSEIRAAFQAHPADVSAAPLAALLPPEALLFARETGCYAPPLPTADGEIIDRYTLRTALIERALALSEAEQTSIDLKRLFELATSATAEGQRLRLLLLQPAAAQAPQDLLLFQRTGEQGANRDYQFS